MERLAIKYLKEWKDNVKAKPLIIRGARQVGKSTLVNEFAKEYSAYIIANLEKEEHLQIFKNLNSPKEIIDAFILRTGIAEDYSKILFFIDEIQESTKAIKLLRYFHEDIPDLNVICAGSLLDFALKETTSFPVGRAEQFVLHPLNFEEYLMALGNKNLLKAYKSIPNTFYLKIQKKGLHFSYYQV